MSALLLQPAYDDFCEHLVLWRHCAHCHPDSVPLFLLHDTELNQAMEPDDEVCSVQSRPPSPPPQVIDLTDDGDQIIDLTED